MISGLHMGAAGAAIATTIENVMASAYYLWYFVEKEPELLHPCQRDFSWKNRFAATICILRTPDRDLLHADESLHESS